MIVFVFILITAAIVIWFFATRDKSNNTNYGGTSSYTHSSPRYPQSNSHTKKSSTDFMLENSSIIRPLEKQLYVDKDNLGVDLQIAAYKNALKAYEQLKNFCYQSESGKQYFQKIWEHCHNSKSPDFAFDTRLKRDLEYLETHYNDLKYVEQHKPMLHSELEQYLLSHQGITQKDIYKDFNPLLKSSIQSELYFMDKNGEIKRVKKGNSYIVELIK